MYANNGCVRSFICCRTSTTYKVELGNIFFSSKSVEVFQLVNSEKFPYRLNFFLDIVMSQLKLKHRCILTLCLHLPSWKLSFPTSSFASMAGTSAEWLIFGIHCVQMF